MPEGRRGDGVEPGSAEVYFVRASRDQESALQIAAINPQLVKLLLLTAAKIFSKIKINKKAQATHPICCCGRRSPRVRHEIRKPRPSSVELSTDLKDMSEGEDVFYTYRASVGSSKDSEGDASPHQSVPQEPMFLCSRLYWDFMS